MIRAYDDYGNVIDLVEWEKQIRAEAYTEGRQDALEELKPFFDECEGFVIDWICDDLCGEFLNPDSDESWCAAHCHDRTGYECIKKWCELKQMKEQNNDRI